MRIGTAVAAAVALGVTAAAGCGDTKTVTETKTVTAPAAVDVGGVSADSIPEGVRAGERWYVRHQCSEAPGSKQCRCEVRVLRRHHPDAADLHAYLVSYAARRESALLEATNTTGKCARALLPAAKPRPAPSAPPPPSSSRDFSGNGSKNLGTITVDSTSVLRWTNDGDVFIVHDADFNLNASSNAHHGTTVVDPGTYRKVEVGAVGNWTISIEPR